ncbi:MAG: hypothetical protein M1544_01775 [Candidatus Marsarchaeota archaeon]|nr:hypothetical protein [Candidatus Marsarchaeota archaeon]
MQKKDKKATISATHVATIILLVAFIVLLYVYMQKPTGAKQSQTTNAILTNQSYNSLEARYTETVSQFNALKSNYTALETNYNGIVSKLNASTRLNYSEINETLYKNKRVYISAPLHNYNYSYVNGCYWISGYYTFSFVAKYSGYIIFNETNTGQQNNFSTAWFSIAVSPQKAVYSIISPYNLTGCTGEGFWGSVAPWSFAAPANNQTIIIPVINGTNYVILYNNNAYSKRDIDEPINVTFSLKYVGFKPISIANPFPNPYTSNTAKKTQAILRSFTKVYTGQNISTVSVSGFNVNLVSVGPPTALGISPANVRVFYYGTLLSRNLTPIFPGSNATFTFSNHTLTVYVNQTDSLYSKWATMAVS